MCGVRDSAAHQLRLIMRAEQGNKIGPLWALVIMLDGPKFRSNYEAGRREFGSGRDAGAGGGERGRPPVRRPVSVLLFLL